MTLCFVLVLLGDMLPLLELSSGRLPLLVLVGGMCVDYRHQLISLKVTSDAVLPSIELVS
jgi:hypothetical protein